MPTAGVSPYNVIAIVNSSSGMTDSDGIAIVAALNILLPIFCTDWSLPLVRATYVSKGAPITNPLRCIILDDADVESALGYHDQSNDVPYAKVFVKTILKYKGSMLYNTDHTLPTIAQTISHEVFELLVDLRANCWWNAADGYTFYAAEVSDPVQGNIVKVQTKGGSLVGMCDWILPTWADPQAKIGPFNHLNTLKAPFTLDKGGYAITMTGGSYKNIFGSQISEFTKKNMCNHSENRTAKCQSPKGEAFRDNKNP